MVKETGFYALCRACGISPAGGPRSSIPENVQEHSHETAVYAHALGIIRREIFGQECDAERLAVLAVYHDASEILTGDLPTPIKYHDRTPATPIKRSSTPRTSGFSPCCRRSCAGHTRAHSQHRRTRKSSSRQPTSLGAAPVHRRAQGGQPRISLRRGADAPRH